MYTRVLQSSMSMGQVDFQAGYPTQLDAGLLPVEELAALGSREGWRRRPIYQAHRWFARRLGCSFRGLLTAAAISPTNDFWTAYYRGTDWQGRTLLDPFVGGGTSVFEAWRLGANTVGVDIDAVACAITRFEMGAFEVPDLGPSLEYLKREIGSGLTSYYRTLTPEGERREVLHYFWVQAVDCSGCQCIVEAHPSFQLAYEAEGSVQWVFCPGCHGVQQIDRQDTELRCESCCLTQRIAAGNVRYGRLTCPHCGTVERLIDVASRTGCPPKWRLFALESLEEFHGRRSVPMTERRFHAATHHDVEVLDNARRALEARRAVDGMVAWIPDRRIPQEARSDDRLLRYGYERYQELFNPRQLLHLSRLAEGIASLKGPARSALALAFSAHLTTNCMMAHYAFGWRRLSPLFDVRAYRHVTRPVEINPWLDGVGRGTFPNAVRQVQRAAAFARDPVEPQAPGGFHPAAHVRSSAGEVPSSRILHGNARHLDLLPDNSVHFVLTDPPYYDNVAYSELSDFFLPWLQQLNLAPPDPEALLGIGENLAARSRDLGAVRVYRRGLKESFRELARVLRPDGRLVFTYQHHDANAWYAVACALRHGGFRPVQLFPLLGDGHSGLHNHPGATRWDAVFVAVKRDAPRQDLTLILSERSLQAAQDHCSSWTRRLQSAPNCNFRPADEHNFNRACLVAAALGLFSDPHGYYMGHPLLLELQALA